MLKQGPQKYKDQFLACYCLTDRTQGLLNSESEKWTVTSAL